MKIKLIGMIWVLMNLAGCSSLIMAPQPASMDAHQATNAKTGLSAVDKLIAKGDAQRRRGELVLASATLERALRLSPRSGAAYVALARVHLDKNDYSEAQYLAEKSLSLPRKTRQAQKEAWLIISTAKKLKGDAEGALSAARRARQL